MARSVTGYAFPSKFYKGPDCHGMTLREYYAGLAMGALASSHLSHESIARFSVLQAEALIKALEDEDLTI